MNPSVAELADAVRKLPSQRAVLLPNNSNIMMAAQQAAKQLGKEKPPRHVTVVPAKNMPQGVAALTAFDPLAEDLDDLKGDGVTDERGAGRRGDTGRAYGRSGRHERSSRRLIGLRNGKLVICGNSLQEVSLDLLKKMDAAKGSLITIYYGNFVAQAAAQDFAETVRASMLI